MRLEVILVGDELLEDMGGAQPPYIAELLQEVHSDLRALGLGISRLTVAGDARGELSGLLAGAVARDVDIVVTVGGLGPTHDDLVREEVAAVLGSGPPVTHPEAMEWLLDAYRQRGIPTPEGEGGWERMAQCPKGASPIRNAAGMACGLSFSIAPSTEVRCLPGVTYEALPMWRASIMPELRSIAVDPGDRGESTVVVKGLREGRVGPVVETVLAEAPSVRGGVYLMDLVEGRFCAIRVVLRGPREAVADATRTLEGELSAIAGATVEVLPEGGGDRVR